MDPDERYHRRTHAPGTTAGLAEPYDLAEAGWWFCEALDCPVYARRDDLCRPPARG